MIYNNNTYVTILTTDAIALGISDNKRKSNDDNITIIGYDENENISQNVLNVVINTMNHKEILELMETNEWKSNIVF